MEDAPPSYETAITKDHWKIIAQYIPSRDLCSAALVSQKWHEIFAPHLWGNPASHFGEQNDTVYVALTRFKRTLSWARLCVRELTHTLHLPPAHAEIYGGPHSDWLRDILERLPRLQSLIVNGLPFFDHASLLTLRYSSPSRRAGGFPVYGLRLLDASCCNNSTSNGLSEALIHFPALISLDLSRTIAAKDVVVFSKLQFFPNLRVLKLRGLGLKDSDFSVIVASIGTRVRSLDIRENTLTDVSARMLLDSCLKEAISEPINGRMPLTPVQGNWPSESYDNIGSEDLDKHLRTKLTQGFVGRLAIEDADDVGITHLYISKNEMTVEGVSGLIRSKRLQVLDIGTLSKAFRKPRSLSMDSIEDQDDDFVMPGAEKLTQVLAEYASERMVYLRINYSIVTEEATASTISPQRSEMEGDLAVYRPKISHELEAKEPPMPELDAHNTAVFELPGHTMQSPELTRDEPELEDLLGLENIPRPGDETGGKISPGISRAPTIEVTEERPPEGRRGSAFAPEPVQCDGPLSPVSPLVEPHGGLSPIMFSFNGTLRSSSLHSNEEPQKNRSHRNSMNSTYYVEDRRSRLEFRQSHENRLHPGMLPKVHTLILTDVPTQTDRPEVVDRLIQFIKDCAEETAIAKLRARFTYALPPGRSRVVAEREYAHSLFALRRIVLEMAAPKTPPKKISTSWRRYPTKSSTEDVDSEAFWDAATHDFSFFGDEECGLPNQEPGRGIPLAAMNGLMIDPTPELPTPNQPQTQSAPCIDVVSEISKFRQDRKAALQAAIGRGDADLTIEGYWPGDITVIRQPGDSTSRVIDYYGNQFEGGYRYR
ncbi:leucine rich repeat protein [Lepidopterella palustris CBS 459.81]|uniref:Leucine rich repeat protein n=1 Tax=Lepidopterella palustris CBS 459.81 TaxID=1314670 RepID=A0A8E2EJK2_9PEZI|nr:leucine rich repeat protein [Lepidopterella palustris CBS 459.81]